MKHEFCNNCKFLSLTEEQQNKYKSYLSKNKSHYCILYRKNILHKEYHPKLPRLEECIRANHNFELENSEIVVGIILSEQASSYLEELSKAKKKTYAEIIEKFIDKEYFMHKFYDESLKMWQCKNDSKNTFIAEGHYLNMSRNNGKSNKILEDNLNKIKRNDD